jgi:glycosyltransferase involved in cell wall biosynthesis
MKISIISDEHFPYTGADTEVIVNTASALAQQGAKVYLMTPHLWDKQQSTQQICDYYGVKASFTHLPVLNPFPPERKLRLQTLSHGLSSSLHPLFWQSDIVHTRDLQPLLLAHLFRRKWSYETYRRHSKEKPWLKHITQKLNLNRAIGAVSHSEQGKQDLIELGFPESQVLVARPGFNTNVFENPPSMQEARAGLKLDQRLKIAGYLGNIGPDKGVEWLLRATKEIPELTALIVGGHPEDIQRLQMIIEQEQLDRQRIILTGHQPSAQMPIYLSACDVLVIPPVKKQQSTALSKLFPSVLRQGTPLKLYGYWAANRPIVAADQDFNLELLVDQQTAYLFDQRHFPAFCHQLREAIFNIEKSSKIAQIAKQRVMEITYENRAKALLDFFERRLGCLPS